MKKPSPRERHREPDAEPDPEPIPTPKMTRYEQLAMDVLSALGAMMDEVGKLSEKEERSAAFIRTHIGVPIKFVDTIVNAVQSTPELERLQQMNIAGAYSSSHLGRAFRRVVLRLAMACDELQHLLDTRQANVASEALHIYAIAKMLIRRKNRHGLDIVTPAIVARMKRDLGGRGVRKKKTSVTPAPKKRRSTRVKRTMTQRLRRRPKQE
jgi:hypothetical protein